MPSLTIVSGPNEGDYYPLATRTLVIGRDEGCPVQIVDSMASRKHVQIRYDEPTKQHIALDMKSTNGTLFNGRAVTAEVPLVDGDEITIGSSRIVYYITEFPNKESAISHYKQRGERARSTIQQR
jgi:pSer/pThr/pTyr-binding forkhead associated (FHA) protein